NKTYLDFDLDKALGDKSAILKKINQCFKAAEKESKDYKEFSINHGYFRQYDNGDWSGSTSHTNRYFHKAMNLKYTKTGIKIHAELTKFDKNDKYIVKYDIDLPQTKYSLPQVELENEGEAERFINSVLDQFNQEVRKLPDDMRSNAILEQILTEKIGAAYDDILDDRNIDKLFL
ncbi:MAG: hypothetical protein IKN07_03575, partial [Lachnospiraceae bacterium]|nr:hypothetical protein [Lachnospiraceae bacterium]